MRFTKKLSVASNFASPLMVIAGEFAEMLPAVMVTGTRETPVKSDPSVAVPLCVVSVTLTSVASLAESVGLTVMAWSMSPSTTFASGRVIPTIVSASLRIWPTADGVPSVAPDAAESLTVNFSVSSLKISFVIATEMSCVRAPPAVNVSVPVATL